MRIHRPALHVAAGARRTVCAWSVGSLETGHYARTGTAATRCAGDFAAADLPQRLSQAAGLVASARACPDQPDGERATDAGDPARRREFCPPDRLRERCELADRAVVGTDARVRT